MDSKSIVSFVGNQNIYWYTEKFPLILADYKPLTRVIEISTHYSDVIMDTMTSQITSLTIIYSTAYSGADQRKQQSSGSLTFVRGIHRWSVNSPLKGPVTRKMFPIDGVTMRLSYFTLIDNWMHVVVELGNLTIFNLRFYCFPRNSFNLNCDIWTMHYDRFKRTLKAVHPLVSDEVIND